MTDPSAGRVAPYPDSHAHLADELRALDLLLGRRAVAWGLECRARPTSSGPHPLYISHEEAAWLLRADDPTRLDSAPAADLEGRLDRLRRTIDARVAESDAAAVPLTLIRLVRLFGLSPLERQAIVVCLAPELRRKYDRLYAYLQDDITRRRPSADLVLDLLCPTEAERWAAKPVFSDEAPLLRYGLLRPVEDPASPSGSSDLARFLRMDPRVTNYLLGDNTLDGRVRDVARLSAPAEPLAAVLVESTAKQGVARVVRRHLARPPEGAGRLVLHLHGASGAGHDELALGLCAEFGCPLLRVDLEAVLGREADAQAILRAAFREGVLFQAAMFLDHADVLLRDDDRSRAAARLLAGAVAEYGWLTVLAGERPWSLVNVFGAVPFHSVTLPIPDVPLREAAWARALERSGAPAACGGKLARRFRLTPGQIEAAVRLAEDAELAAAGPRPLSYDALAAACRRGATHRLAEVAVKVEPRCGWDDLVLPVDQREQLRQLCLHVRHDDRVFREWGFASKVPHGRGVSALFSGSPGTGKTMAAEVIAGELQLDLYKVDLSAVVSKYIGETEKNLARIFQEGEASHAILFFDEADALFGKRTEISDAHDRYANLETSYLLQKMDEYEGVVILATNLPGNLDEAFTRRLRFIVEFPFPDVASRAEIWRKHFPARAPVGDGLDYAGLARLLPVAGGTIRNIVLHSAFLAAENGGVITVAHLLQGAQREFEKIGKLWPGPSPQAARPAGTGS